ncbi:unnamed protein product [Orchesella dallaii]|uniref:Uncharacterized protein n=1 Tax=Orchesella dallaii TaxID=48710 RepID=A0ABP1S446_9HEXA
MDNLSLCLFGKTLDFTKGFVDFIGVCQRVGLVKPDKPLTPDLLAIIFLKYSGCSFRDVGVGGIICEEKGDISSNPTSSVGYEMEETAPIVVTASNNEQSSSVNLEEITNEERMEICAHHTLPVSAGLEEKAPIVVAATDTLQNCFVRLESDERMVIHANPTAQLVLVLHDPDGHLSSHGLVMEM